MRNKNRSTRSPAHLDEIQEGCIIDGSHAHPDDFSVQIILYAQELGHEPSTETRAWMMVRLGGLDEHLTPEGCGLMSESLSEASDEAVTWLNQTVATEPHLFYVHESDLFLGREDDDV
jgi:hypothetical protein